MILVSQHCRRVKYKSMGQNMVLLKFRVGSIPRRLEPLVVDSQGDNAHALRREAENIDKAFLREATCGDHDARRLSGPIVGEPPIVTLSGRPQVRKIVMLQVEQCDDAGSGDWGHRNREGVVRNVWAFSQHTTNPERERRRGGYSNRSLGRASGSRV